MTGLEAIDKLVDLYKKEVNIDHALALIALDVLDCERFVKGYGAAANGGEHAHHAYPGGLAVHTYEVASIALDTAKTNSLKVNIPVLLTAAICHDYKKVEDYDSSGNKTEYRKLVRHLSGSHAWFANKALEYNLLPSLVIEVEHCILAHHGRQEWGSPIEPQTVEASILHYADMLSMQYGVGR